MFMFMNTEKMNEEEWKVYFYCFARMSINICWLYFFGSMQMKIRATSESTLTLFYRCLFYSEYCYTHSCHQVKITIFSCFAFCFKCCAATYVMKTGLNIRCYCNCYIHINNNKKIQQQINFWNEIYNYYDHEMIVLFA